MNEERRRQVWYPYHKDSTIKGLITGFEWEPIPADHQANSVESSVLKDGKRLVVDYDRDGRSRFPTRTVVTNAMLRDMKEQGIEVGDIVEIYADGQKNGSQDQGSNQRTGLFVRMRKTGHSWNNRDQGAGSQYQPSHYEGTKFPG